MNKFDKKSGKSSFSFGSGSRKGFQSSFHKQDVEMETSELKEIEIKKNKKVDQIYKKSSESMSELQDNSIALTVTSPPYNVDKDISNKFC